ncbi:MAG: hypothetical protein FWF51_03405 [Chitinivibrionia bacterium]|nr:hypothetical protein [Chitinivibrionia bacterium]
MKKYKELDDTVEEVYRIRESIMKRFNYDPKAYHKYLRETEYKVKQAGCRYATEAELAKIKQAHKRERETI